VKFRFGEIHRSLCHSLVSFEKVDYPRQPSREAAKECSPQRKLWVTNLNNKQAPKGRKKRCADSE